MTPTRLCSKLPRDKSSHRTEISSLQNCFVSGSSAAALHLQVARVPSCDPSLCDNQLSAKTYGISSSAFCASYRASIPTTHWPPRS